jgi:3-deoxy-D-manno-octulosonic acid (KDO) 8-phosphate synthase
VHPHPQRALSDGPNMIDFGELERLLRQVKKIDKIVKSLL